MNEEALLKGLLDTWSLKHGWVAAVVSWIGTSRVVFKLCSGKLEELIHAFVDYSVKEKDEAAIASLNRFFAGRAWRLFAFLCDYVASVKLPLRVKAAEGDTFNQSKPLA